MSPHAMNAPIFGITIALRLLPNCCIDFLISKINYHKVRIISWTNKYMAAIIH